MKRNKSRSHGQLLLFVAYGALMIWLLFGQRTQRRSGADNLNVVPFATLKLYLNILKNSTDPYLIRHAFINLAGNVIMFIPLGFFLPYLRKETGNFFSMFVCTVVVIILIESVQYITGLGSCDIDDLILNVPGVMIGWLIRWFVTKKHK